MKLWYTTGNISREYRISQFISGAQCVFGENNPWTWLVVFCDFVSFCRSLTGEWWSVHELEVMYSQYNFQEPNERIIKL